MHNYEVSYDLISLQVGLPSLGGAGGGPSTYLSLPFEWGKERL